MYFNTFQYSSELHSYNTMYATKKIYIVARSYASSETQGQLGREEINRARQQSVTSQAEKAPGNRLLPDHFQTALPMLLPDWAEKSFVLFCPIGEQQLPRYCCVFLHDDFRIAILAWFVHKHSVFEGNFHFNFPRERRNIEMMTSMNRATIHRKQLG